MNNVLRCISAAVAVLVLSATAAGATTITTYPLWNGSDGVGPLIPTNGSGGATAVGESFTNTPNFSTLDSFTFSLTDVPGGSLHLTAFVYAWTGTAITGPALFSSAPISLLPSPPATGFQTVTFATPGTTLTPGGQYVAFLTTIGAPNIGTESSGIGQVFDNGAGPTSFFGGGLVYSQATTLADLAAGGSPWNYNGTFQVLAFQMVFDTAAAPVPEPSTLSLMTVISAVFGVPLALKRSRSRRRPVPVANS